MKKELVPKLDCVSTLEREGYGYWISGICEDWKWIRDVYSLPKDEFERVKSMCYPQKEGE